MHTNRKPVYHFLLVNNTNLRPISQLFPSHRATLIILSLSTGLFLFNALVFSNLCEYHHKWYIAKNYRFRTTSSSRQYASSYRQFNVVDCEIYHMGELTQNNVTDIVRLILWYIWIHCDWQRFTSVMSILLTTCLGKMGDFNWVTSRVWGLGPMQRGPAMSFNVVGFGE